MIRPLTSLVNLLAYLFRYRIHIANLLGSERGLV